MDKEAIKRILFPYSTMDLPSVSHRVLRFSRVEASTRRLRSETHRKQFLQSQDGYNYIFFPIAGGRLGNCYLLWGDDLKHDYFPFVAIVGPDWKYTFALYLVPAITLVAGLGTMKLYDTWKTWAAILEVVLFVLTEYCILVTAMSQPVDPENRVPCSRNPFLVSLPVMCKFNRTCPRVHHCYDCDVCCYQLDHHCMWMGKCIGYNNLLSFKFSLGMILASFIVSAFLCLLVS